jgi:large subunit ribosomal protein L18
MFIKISKDTVRRRIHTRIRKKLSGSGERPRLAVFRSLQHIYVQLIDDATGKTIVSAASNEKNGANGGNVAGATAVGKLVAERAKEKGITKVVFDRGGFLYHGRIKALAEAARAAGLEF